jgi:plastocyanin
MRRFKAVLPVVAAALAVTCTQSPISPDASSTADTRVAALNAQGLRLEATIDFGLTTGSHFPPGSHDQSFRGADSLVPQTVVIDAGGTVTFKTFGVHQVAIYEPGKAPEDVNLAATKPSCVPGVPLIDDAVDRLEVLDDQPCQGGEATLSYTFDEPGRYLVICAFLPHFAFAKMYGWVVVRDR